MSAPASLHKRAFGGGWRMRALWAGLLLYVIYAASLLDFTWARFVIGLATWGTVPRPHVPP